MTPRMDDPNPNPMPLAACVLLGLIAGICCGAFLKERATASHVAELRRQLAELHAVRAAEVMRSVPPHSAPPPPVRFNPPSRD